MIQALFWIIIAAAAVLLIMKNKILGFIKEKVGVEIPHLLWGIGVIVLAIYGMIELSSYKNDSAYKNTSSPTPKAKNNQYYIIDGDTIAELLSVEGTMSNIWTKKTYNSTDGVLVSALVNHLIPDNSGLTHFLFKEKINDESYYAYYNNGKLTMRITPEEMIENIKEEMNTPISSSGLQFVTIFFAKLDKFNENVANYDKDGNLKKELVKFQTKNFPKARKEYYEHVKNALWEKDIEVKMSGKNITYIGHMFVRNKVIKDTYLEILPELKRLRFKRVSFTWYDGGDITYWDIDSKNDNE